MRTGLNTSNWSFGDNYQVLATNMGLNSNMNDPTIFSAEFKNIVESE